MKLSSLASRFVSRFLEYQQWNDFESFKDECIPFKFGLRVQTNQWTFSKVAYIDYKAVYTY